jgi:mannose-6-phosphate isomerase-like protein (cupin superfamily)
MAVNHEIKTAPYVVGPGGGEVISGLGVWVKASTSLTGGQVAVVEIVNSGFGGPPLHVHHGHDEMFYVVEGEYLLQFGGEITVAPAGTFAFFPRGTPHTFASRGTVPGRLLNMSVPSGLEMFVRELNRLATEGANDEEIRELCAAWETNLVGPPLSPS